MRKKCCLHEASAILPVHFANLPHISKFCENQRMFINLNMSVTQYSYFRPFNEYGCRFPTLKAPKTIKLVFGDSKLYKIVTEWLQRARTSYRISWRSANSKAVTEFNQHHVYTQKYLTASNGLNRRTLPLARVNRASILIPYTVVHWTINIVLIFTLALNILRCVFVQIMSTVQGGLFLYGFTTRQIHSTLPRISG
jgi:hypothetical protein